jgi:DNA-binding HxlR family transcriptional regulator
MSKQRWAPTETPGTMADRQLRAERLVQLLAGRWTLAVIGKLSDGGLRYQDLHDDLDGISYKVLTETLRRAERDGLINRQVDPERVETATLYQLTDLGRSLHEPLSALTLWVDGHWQSVEAAQQHWGQLRADGRKRRRSRTKPPV